MSELVINHPLSDINDLSVPERTFWQSDTVTLSDMYYTSEVERRTQVSEDEAQLIGSLCTSGDHAAALDIDFPAELEALALGCNLLTVYQKVPRTPYVRLLRTMEEQSLIPPGHSSKLISDLPLLNRSVSPLMVGLSVPARLLPSSTPGHNHLYFDTERTWNEYAILLKRFQAARLIQKGFLDASLRRGQTMLRMPGVNKFDVDQSR